MLTWRTAAAIAALGSATNSHGSEPRPRLHHRARLAGLLLALVCSAALAPSAAAGRILFSSDWSGHMEIYAVDPARPAVITQLTSGSSPGCVGLAFACGAIDALPSPDERQVLYRQMGAACSNSWWVTRRGDGTPIALGEARQDCYPPYGSDAVWSPDSRQIAYLASDGLHVVRSDGTQNRVVGSGRPAWATKLSRANLRSPDGRWVVLLGGKLLQFERTKGSKHWLTNGEFSTNHAWSPDGRRLAYLLKDGLWVFDIRTGKARLLTKEIAPDPYFKFQRAYRFVWLDQYTLAYVAGRIGLWDITSGPLRTVTVTGRARTLLGANARYIGRTLSIASVRTGSRLPLRSPDELPPERAGPESVLAEGPIDDIAVDGDHVAFTACLDTYVWTRSTGTVRTLSGAKPGGCNWEQRSYYYSLALDGDRLATAYRGGCTGVLHLALTSLTSLEWTQLERSNITCGSAMKPALDDLEGENGLLVYSSATETQPCCPSGAISTARQEIRRVGPNGCPCPVIASSPGTLVAADVDRGKVLAYGRNETWLLDRDGDRLWTIPVGPLGAQLGGGILVLLLRGQLQVYSTRPYGFVRTIPLPDVPSSGHECELRCSHQGVELTLEDGGHGRALYLLKGRLHMVNLSSGRDTVIGSATTARFTHDGLVYADGSRLFFLPEIAFP